MSGNSSTGECPKCGAETDVYVDWKPFDIAESRCLSCGWCCYPAITQLTLDEVNDDRAMQGMKLLTKLKTKRN